MITEYPNNRGAWDVKRVSSGMRSLLSASLHSHVNSWPSHSFLEEDPRAWPWCFWRYGHESRNTRDNSRFPFWYDDWRLLQISSMQQTNHITTTHNWRTFYQEDWNTMKNVLVVFLFILPSKKLWICHNSAAQIKHYLLEVKTRPKTWKFTSLALLAEERPKRWYFF